MLVLGIIVISQAFIKAMTVKRTCLSPGRQSGNEMRKWKSRPKLKIDNRQSNHEAFIAALLFAQR